MTESRNLWNEDELLSQLEEAQDQIDYLQSSVDGLRQVIDKKNEQLTELRWEHSSEISKLQLALQQAQKKIQEQSDQIVKLNGADLILKDNEKLKSEIENVVNENVKLVSENDRIMKEAALVVEADKTQLQEKEKELQAQINAAKEAEAKAHEKEANVDGLIRSRESLLRTESAIRVMEAESRCEKESDRKLNAYWEKWEDDRMHLTRIIAVTVLYSIAVTAAQIIQWIF